MVIKKELNVKHKLKIVKKMEAFYGPKNTDT